MTEAQIQARVRKEVARAGGVNALAREWGVSGAYLSGFLRGEIRAGEKIADRLGLRAVRTITYRYEAVTS